MIKNKLSLVVAFLIGLILLTYMITFQVRYDEVAVLTTWEKADTADVKNEPGLYPRFPWPIQRPYKYSTKLQILDDQIEEQQTKDGYSVVLRTYLTWRIEDPLAFFKSLKDADVARKQIQPLLRDLRATVGKYNFDQLVNVDEKQLKLAEIEKESKEIINDKLSKANYGIKVEHLGIRRILLPENVTNKVFTRMSDTRNRLAQSARTAGTAQAATIRSEANTAQQTILAFAERRAQAIRSEGDNLASEYYAVFNKDEDFAIFLRQVDALKKMLAHNTTFVLDANDLSPLELMGKGKSDGKK